MSLRKIVVKRFLIIGSLLLAASTTAIADNTPTADQQRLQGTWRSYAVQKGERKSTPDSKGATGLTFTFADAQVSHEEHGQPIYSGAFKLDPKTTPGAIDITVAKGPEFKPGVVLLGIYKFEKDALVICVGEPSESKGSHRPKDFSVKETRDITMHLRKEDKQPSR